MCGVHKQGEQVHKQQRAAHTLGHGVPWRLINTVYIIYLTLLLEKCCGAPSPTVPYRGPPAMTGLVVVKQPPFKSLMGGWVTVLLIRRTLEASGYE